MTTLGVKAILGYDIMNDVPVGEFEEWLWDVHVPDLRANPFLERVVFNTVVRPITASSSGAATADDPQSFYRITELHFADHDAYEAYLQWFQDNPIPSERGTVGRMTFRFYVLTDSVEANPNS